MGKRLHYIRREAAFFAFTFGGVGAVESQPPLEETKETRRACAGRGLFLGKLWLLGLVDGIGKFRPIEKVCHHSNNTTVQGPEIKIVSSLLKIPRASDTKSLF